MRSLALDVGSDQIQSLRVDEGTLRGRTMHAVWTAAPDSPNRREVLQEIGLSFGVCDGHLLMFGDGALRYASLFQTPLMSLMPEGKLPLEDPLSRQVLSKIIELILPESFETETTCYLTLPGTEHPGSPTGQFIQHLVKLRGYQSHVMTASYATILAEMQSESFTGLAINLGANSMELSYARNAIEIGHAVVALGGNWIDAQLAEQLQMTFWDSQGNRHLDTLKAKQWRESFHGDLMHPQTGQERKLRILCEQLLDHIWHSATEVINQCQVLQEVPILLSGGIAKTSGLLELMHHEATTRDIPFHISQIRAACDSEFTVSRGCLVRAALNESSAPSPRHAA